MPPLKKFNSTARSSAATLQQKHCVDSSALLLLICESFLTDMTRRFFILVAVLSAAHISARADLVKSSVLENDAIYLRVGNVEKNLPQEIQSAETALAATNKISGTVLDLRFTGGDDLDSAKAISDLFAQMKLPVAILVNGETAGAAIGLAKELQNSHAGLVFGSSTNLSPDIFISVSADDEKQFLENPWGTIFGNQVHAGSATTNDFLPYIDHTTEADLVRARIKDGEEDETIAKPEPQKPFIRDPVLARGLDFIKAEAVLHLSHS
jgi:hypothetical protein